VALPDVQVDYSLTPLSEHLPPSTAAKLAAEITGAPRKALYGS
jgi:hypothetical protein